MYPFFDFGIIKIPTYGTCLVIAFALVIYIVTRCAKKVNIRWEDVIIVATCVGGMAMLGGSVLFTFVTYSISDIINSILNGDFHFLEHGGIVFYGGLIGGIIGAFIGAKIAKINLFDLEDSIVPWIPLGHAIGRIGCLLGGCCYGMEYSGPLAVYYKNSITGLSPDVGYFPVQPLESLLDIAIMFILILYSRKKRKKMDLMLCYLVLYAVMRFCTELFRGDAIRGLYSGISTSQWISIGIITFAVLFVIIRKIIERKAITEKR